MVLALRMRVQPGKRDDLLQVVRRMLEPDRLAKGCLSYHFYQDIEDRNAFVFVEEWESRTDLEDYIRTESFRRLLAVMDVLREAPKLDIYKVSETAGMDFVEAVLEDTAAGRGTLPIEPTTQGGRRA